MCTNDEMYFKIVVGLNHYKMKTKLLDYYKVILHKVSFDAKLFRKEYGKAVRSLQNNNEIGHLKNWLKETGLHSILSHVQDSDMSVT